MSDADNQVVISIDSCDLPDDYREESSDVEYPSDRLALGQLRAIWPNPEELAQVVRDVRVMEKNVGSVAFVDEGIRQGRAWMAEPVEAACKTGEHVRDIIEDDSQSLKTFYIMTGLAPGAHAAELLIRGIQQQGRKQVRPR